MAALIPALIKLFMSSRGGKGGGSSSAYSKFNTADQKRQAEAGKIDWADGKITTDGGERVRKRLEAAKAKRQKAGG